MPGNPVEVTNAVQVKTRTVSTVRWVPPGLVPAAPYADGDAIGGTQEIDVPESGVIQSAVYWDRDDEGLAVDLLILARPFATAIADNAAMALTDDSLLSIIHVIAFATFSDFTNGQAAFVASVGKAYVTLPELRGKLYAQIRARGALNIAAGSEPMFQIDILADE